MAPQHTDEVLVELIPGRLTFWATDSVPGAAAGPGEAAGFHFFSLGEDFVYEPFAKDFGPLQLSMVYRYCQLLQQKLSSPALANMHIVHCAPTRPTELANAVCLSCLYQVIVLGFNAEEAFEPFKESGVQFLAFRDALHKPSTFDLTILDCVRGMELSMELGWFNWGVFDLHAYESLNNFDHCGLNWLIPGKLLAFAGPSDSYINPYGYRGYTPEDYVDLFHEANVGTVIRLNDKEYDESVFTNSGIRHVDLIFHDGSCPSFEIISKFVETVESEPMAVAVHCKAGLGRTGTLIALYAMITHRFPARQFIGWSRLCRPGSILGEQQRFLVAMEEVLLRTAPLPFSGKADVAKVFALSPSLCTTDGGGEDGQGARLCAARHHSRAVAGSWSRCGVLPALTQQPSECMA